MAAIKDKKELSTMSKDKLVKELAHAKNEGYQARMKHAQGELKETHSVRIWKRYIARIKTFITQSK